MSVYNVAVGEIKLKQAESIIKTQILKLTEDIVWDLECFKVLVELQNTLAWSHLDKMQEESLKEFERATT